MAHKTDLNPEGASHAGAPEVDAPWGRGSVLTPATSQPAMGSFSPEVRATTRRRQKPWSGPECPNPDCGSVRTPVRTSGRDTKGRPIRDRRCADCGTAFVTVEAVVPGVTFAQVDEEHRRRKREGKRQRFGWQPRLDMQRSARVHISVTPYIRRKR